MDIDVRLVQRLKLFFVSDLRLEGNETDASREHAKKVPEPKDSIPSGSDTVSKPSQPEKT